MRSLSGVLPVEQQPRIQVVPPAPTSAGAEAVALAEHAGLFLDPWQQWALDRALRERPDGKWAAFEVGLILARQNGKGGVLEALELAHLFLFNTRKIVHSAHLFETSLDAYVRLWSLIEDTPDLLAQVRLNGRGKREPVSSHGQEGIILEPNAKKKIPRRSIKFRTRTKNGGRGLSADLVILDESMILPSSVMNALMPTLSARPNPQLWYVGSAVDQETHEYGGTQSALRRRAMSDDPALIEDLCYLEWSPGEWADFEAGLIDLDDVEMACRQNPSTFTARPDGTGITRVSITRERRSMTDRGYVVERLSVGDYPDPEHDADTVVDEMAWRRMADRGSQIDGPVQLAVDMDPGRTRVAIGAAGRRTDGKWHVEVIDFEPGTRWVGERLAGLVERHPAAGLPIVDRRSPAFGLVKVIEDADGGQAWIGEQRVRLIDTTDVVRACGAFVDAAAEDALELRHLGQLILTEAVRGAGKRNVGDGFAFSRRGSNIAPLMAVALALLGVMEAPKPRKQAMPRGVGRPSESRDLADVSW